MKQEEEEIIWTKLSLWPTPLTHNCFAGGERAHTPFHFQNNNGVGGDWAQKQHQQASCSISPWLLSYPAPDAGSIYFFNIVFSLLK